MGGRNYTYLTEKQLNGEMSDFPPLDTKRCEREANSLFTTWLFVKDTRGMREITCSSCGHSEKLLAPMRVMDETWAYLVTAGHDQPATCPWCGAGGRIKERRYIRNGIKLTEYHPVLFLQEKDGVLYAQGFWTRKLYDGKMSAEELAQPPLFMETEACRFRIGRADGYMRDYDGRYIRQTVEGNYGRKHWLREAFTSGVGYYSGFECFTVFGTEAFYRSELRYCGYEIFRGRPKLTDGTICGDLIRYLTAATQYPRQIERIAKAGWRGLIEDLIYRRKKNVAILKWEETDLKKSLGLSGEEFKAFRTAKCSPYLIADYKKFRKAGLPASFEDLAKIYQWLGYGPYSEVLKLCLRYRIRPGRLHRYLDEHTGSVNSIAVAKYSYGTVQIWKDWLDMAGKLGYDLQNETVLLPKELGRKHDEAAEELNRRTLREERKAQAERIKERRKRYSAEINGFLFRPAESSREIVDEGKALQHCVGGYAERHMAGKLTIIFLRRAENPEASLYTIEMHDDRLIQIHGFKNERMPGAKDPHAVVGPELDAWLLWIKRGSKRDKQGNPILPKIKEKEAKTA